MMPQPEKETLSDMLLKTIRSNWVYILIVVGLVVFPHAIGWFTGEGPFGIERGGRVRAIGDSIFWQGVMIEVFVLVILAMSYNLMFGFAGVISFGHALFFGLGGYTMGLILEESGIASEGVALLVGMVGAVLLAGIVGFFVGLASLRLRGVYFAIFTLAIAEMGFIWVSRWSLTNAEDGFSISNLPDVMNPTNNRLFFYYIGLVGVIFTFLFIRRLMFSPTGRIMLAVRENEDRARAIGYNTLIYKLSAITIASMMASGAGMLHVMFNKKVGPEIMGVPYTIDPLLMVIIGGVATFSGPLIGAAGLHLSERILSREELFGIDISFIDENWSLILGSIFVIVVLLFPNGIVGSYNQWRAKRRARAGAKQGDPPMGASAKEMLQKAVKEDEPA